MECVNKDLSLMLTIMVCYSVIFLYASKCRIQRFPYILMNLLYAAPLKFLCSTKSLEVNCSKAYIIVVCITFEAHACFFVYIFV